MVTSSTLHHFHDVTALNLRVFIMVLYMYWYYRQLLIAVYSNTFFAVVSLINQTAVPSSLPSFCVHIHFSLFCQMAVLCQFVLLNLSRVANE